MGVVAEMCDEVAVMYAGRIVEEAPIGDVFKRSRHPYTKGLLAQPAAEEPRQEGACCRRSKAWCRRC